MKTQITDLFGMDVYTDKAVRVGNVDDAVLNIDTKKVDFLAVGNLNPDLFQLKGFKGIRVPFRIIKSVGDVIIIRHFNSMFPTQGVED